MEPKNLKTPRADLVLVRFTDPDARGLARYCLWRMPPIQVGAGSTIANFSAPSDAQAEQLVEAWCAGRRLMANSVTLAWTNQLSAIEEEKKATYHEAVQGPDREAARVALDEYHAAESEARLLRDGFFGKWPRLTE